VNVLGISAMERDATAALIRDGRVIASAAEERFTRQRHDPNFPHYAVEFCLDAAGLKAHELDAIVFYQEPHVRFTRVLSTSLAALDPPSFVRSMKAWLGEKLWARGVISRRLDVHPDKISYVPHHLSLAAQAFASSPFEEAAVLVVGGEGEWDCAALCSGYRGGGLKLDTHEILPYPHSLGLVLSAFSELLGFQRGSVRDALDLAAYGSPRFADEIARVIQPQEDGTYRIDTSWLRMEAFLESGGSPLTPRFLEAFGPIRDARAPAVADRDALTDGEQRYADIAASLQHVLEETLLKLCRRLHDRTGARNLCVTGEVMDNPRAVARLLADSPFERVFVPADPGEGGAAIGAALLRDAESAPTTQGERRPDPYLGRAYDEARDAAMIEHLQIGSWATFRKEGCEDVEDAAITVERFEDFETLARRTAEELEAGRIVGWLQGRFESGSQGLGNRALLTDPRSEAARSRLRERVTTRALLHPSALAIAEEAAAEVLEGEAPWQWPLRWGQATARVRPEAVERVKAAVHVDGTTLPQVCAAEDNPRFHSLLTAFGERTGLAALLSETFSEANYPMVSSPADALLIFARTDLDTLVINNILVKKVSK